MCIVHETRGRGEISGGSPFIRNPDRCIHRGQRLEDGPCLASCPALLEGGGGMVSSVMEADQGSHTDCSGRGCSAE
jgi:hypothetical protein